MLPERDIQCQPFTKAAVDLIGLWTVKVGHRNITFSALTIIDPVTKLTELVRIENKAADHVPRKFAQTWLSRHSWQQRCVHDIGREFTGLEFKQLLEQCNIKDIPITSRNPTANSISEQMRQPGGNMLRTLILKNKARSEKNMPKI